MSSTAAPAWFSPDCQLVKCEPTALLTANNNIVGLAVAVPLVSSALVELPQLDSRVVEHGSVKANIVSVSETVESVEVSRARIVRH